MSNITMNRISPVILVVGINSHHKEAFVSTQYELLRRFHLRMPSLPLSVEVRERLNRLIHPDVRSQVESFFVDELGNNLFFGGPFFSKKSLLSPEADSIQQVRFAALKLSDGDPQRLSELISPFNGDVVELVSAAGLGSPTWKTCLPDQKTFT